VLEEHEVMPDDVDADGVVRDASVARWVGGARDAYLGGLSVLHELRARAGLELRDRVEGVPPGAALGRPKVVAVTAGVREVTPTSFALALRLRAMGGERDAVANVACAVWLEDPATGEPAELGDDVRDELIALEHAAQHFN
jgi:acyl-CoA thioesterase FadM